ncbi:MAG: hypothetical protein HY596_00755 [Candidatus Omnitrophica bacterium]|nr:hypothetical protein [Candidatus Omnitrophota bacterium]
MYGDIRRLTRGGSKSRDENNMINGPKTRPNTG